MLNAMAQQFTYCLLIILFIRHIEGICLCVICFFDNYILHAYAFRLLLFIIHCVRVNEAVIG